MDQLRMDTSDLNRLSITLDGAARTVGDEVRSVVERGALNIKRDAQRRIGRPPHAPAYASSIGYDVRYRLRGGVEAEIGPDKNRRQGALGNLLEYGSINNAPLPHLAPALAAEAPRFERALEAAVFKALGL